MSFEDLTSEIKNCKKCLLHQTRTNAVPGEGSPKADVLFIGEGPGEQEDKQGRPFVGRAGKFLDELIKSIGVKREDVFIANVVKCRPPGNRDPFPDEIKACSPYLEKQIKLIKPKLIVTLGRHSMERFVPGKKISQDHGKPFRVNGQVYFPSYHPAAALYRGNLREELEADFKKIPKILEKIDELPIPPVEEKIKKIKRIPEPLIKEKSKQATLKI